MAVIGSIRNRGKLIAGVVFFALALFVLGALLENQPGGRGPGSDSVGEIGGEDVSMLEFSTRVDEQADLYRENGTQVDDQLTQQIRNGVWNDILRERTLKVQAEEAGFGTTISKEEFDDIRFGDNVVPDFRNNPQFQGPNGQPNKEGLRQYFNGIQQQMPALYDMQKRTLVPQRIYAKYNALLKKSCFVNKLQLQEEWAQKNTKASFDFVMKRYEQEPDSLYAVNDEELDRYYNAHKNDRKWKQQASRAFVFVQFNAMPTADDIAATKLEMEQLKGDFERTKGRSDSLFVMSRSDTKNAVASAYMPGSADVQNDSLIAHADTGAVVGPFKQNDTWRLVKVKELADVPEAKVRHILLMTQGKSEDEVTAAKNRADSILAVVKRDRSKFPELVKKFSEDPGSNQKVGEEAGVYDWFDKKRMVPEFTAASFDQPVKSITVAKTDYGYHVVEVLDQRTRKERRVLTVDRKVQTVNAMKEAYNKANEFSLGNTDTASFRKSAQEQGLTVTPVDQFRPESPYVPGLQDANTVKTWANRAEVGSKPSAPLASGDSYVVCLLTAVREEGQPKLNDVRDVFTREARKEKKAEALIAKMTGKTDLNALATETGSPVQTATDQAFAANSVPNGGNDVEVIGQIFTLQDGNVSTPLKGDMGVYVVKMNKLVAAEPMPEGAEDKKALADRVRNRAEFQAFNALKEAAGVRDDRSLFY